LVQLGIKSRQFVFQIGHVFGYAGEGALPAQDLERQRHLRDPSGAKAGN
jgi:hypothetical protein